MKPRRDSAPLTVEDHAIWLSLFGGYLPDRGHDIRLRYHSTNADRRDAELMWIAQDSPRASHVHCTAIQGFWGAATDRGPELEPERPWVRVRLDITNCA